VNPPFVFGPFPKGFPIPAKTDLGVNRFLYAFLVGEPDRKWPSQVAPFSIDVRDVATAHVRALKVPATPEDVQKKRYLVLGGTFLNQDAVQLIAEKRPELKDRLPNLANAPPAPGTPTKTDCTRAKVDLGLTDYISWQQYVIDTVDDLVWAEKEWAKL
jgi:nucleoside-diphosphate-sugar epimerase